MPADSSPIIHCPPFRDILRDLLILPFLGHKKLLCRGGSFFDVF